MHRQAKFFACVGISRIEADTVPVKKSELNTFMRENYSKFTLAFYLA